MCKCHYTCGIKFWNVVTVRYFSHPRQSSGNHAVCAFTALTVIKCSDWRYPAHREAISNGWIRNSSMGYLNCYVGFFFDSAAQKSGA